MSYTAMAWARSIKTGSPTMKAVLLAVANYADEEGICWPSQEQLAEDTELSRHSILRALDALEDGALLARERRHRGDGSRTSDLIMLDLSSTVLRSREQRCTQQQPKSHSATAEEPSIEPLSPSMRGRAKAPSQEKLAFDAYNALADELGLSRACNLTDERRMKIRSRLNECGGLIGWQDALAKVRGSPFLRGDNDRGWKVSIDFILQKSSFTRLMEGSYDGSKRPQSSRPNVSRADAFAILDAVADEKIRRAGGLGAEGDQENPGELSGLRQSAA